MTYLISEEKTGSAKTDLVRFKWGFGEGLLQDKFDFFKASKSPIPKRRKLFAKTNFHKHIKGAQSMECKL